MLHVLFITGRKRNDAIPLFEPTVNCCRRVKHLCPMVGVSLEDSVLVKLVDHIDFGQLQTTESRTVGCISINFSFLPEVSHVTLFLIWLTPAIAIYVCTCC